MVDHRAQRLLRVGARIAGGAKDLELAVGAGAARGDLAGVLELGDAVEPLGVLAHQVDQLVDQVGEIDQFALAEIDQRALDAVALGAPAVLVDQNARVACASTGCCMRRR